jgi:hypothetical protein
MLFSFLKAFKKISPNYTEIAIITIVIPKEFLAYRSRSDIVIVMYLF